MKEETTVPIVDALSNIREILGEDVTDVADSIMKSANATNQKIDESVKHLSGLASSVSAFVFEQRQKENNPEQESSLTKLSLFAKHLADGQFRLAGIARKNNQLRELAESVAQDGFKFGTEIMDLQDEARDSWGDLRQFGFELPKSDIEQLMTVN
jgi:hypothetical protein